MTTATRKQYAVKWKVNGMTYTHERIFTSLQKARQEVARIDSNIATFAHGSIEYRANEGAWYEEI